MSIVSVATGKPIAVTTPQDPRGFGLDVARSTVEGFDTFWYYEGETLGYRVLYAWLPKSDAVLAIGVNGQPNAKVDLIGKDLMESVIDTLHEHGRL